MLQKYSLIILISFLSFSHQVIAQKDQIPLDPMLEKASERQLIKIGMITESKPAKLKFGSFSNDNRKGKSTTKGDEPTKLLFSFDVKNAEGALATVEASSKSDATESSKESDQANEISIYISTSLDEDDLWVLLINTAAESKNISLNNLFLTNGTEEIIFKLVTGTPTNKSEVTAPKGIEAFIDDYPIAAMQYYSGGSFSYKKFIWISEKTEPQLQLVMASVFSAMLEVGAYFNGTGFTE